MFQYFRMFTPKATFLEIWFSFIWLSERMSVFVNILKHSEILKEINYRGKGKREITKKIVFLKEEITK